MSRIVHPGQVKLRGTVRGHIEAAGRRHHRRGAGLRGIRGRAARVARANDIIVGRPFAQVRIAIRCRIRRQRDDVRIRSARGGPACDNQAVFVGSVICPGQIVATILIRKIPVPCRLLFRY